MTAMMYFLRSEDWDAPFFKRLAHNDTGAAVGHQGGVVVPRELRTFFPSLDAGLASSVSPTVDRSLRAEMYFGLKHVGDAVIRYQIQTWGGTRNPESRLTDNLGPLRNEASEGDLLLLQRRADAFDRYRLTLIQKTSKEYADINRLTGGRRWGTLEQNEQPVSQSELDEAQHEIATLVVQPFQLVKPAVSRIETRQSRIARSSVFREQVRLEYARRCCISGITVVTPASLYEVESAHLVPVSEGGTDDIRNGIALTQTLHWAFDRGLFGILPNFTVYLPRAVKQMRENVFLKQFDGKSVSKAKTASLRAHPDALHWHIQNRVNQWE